jgi:diguanylate cyclase (GGDEF)-like protein
MPRSLPLKLNLISLFVTIVLAFVIILAGGFMIYDQQRQNAVTRATLAASELAGRAERLLALQLRFSDFLGFEEQCEGVLAGDPFLEASALFDAAGRLVSWSRGADLSRLGDWIGSGIARAQEMHSGAAWFVLAPFGPAADQVEGYTAVVIRTNSVRLAVLRPIAILVLLSLFFCGLSVLILQILFRRHVGRPLAQLVETADALRTVGSENIARLESMSSEDDIGRIYGAMARLTGRLHEANTHLMAQNEELDRAVKERTAELVEANGKLAEDIERRKALEKELKVLAGTDVLTGLLNRSALLERFNQILKEAGRHEWRVGVFFIDLDHFKVINDTLGHHIGDRLLAEISRRILASVRSTDTVARLGGDEFMVILPDIGEPRNAGLVAEKIQNVLRKTIFVDDQGLHIGSSIGISMAPDDSSDAHTLMQNADAAMYHAKSVGRNNYQFFNKAMLEKVQERLAMETRLRDALKNDEFSLHYQPQLRIGDAHMAGAEALIRWKTQDGQLIPPDRFIGVAEETGLIIPLGLWVLERACTQVLEWDAQGLVLERIAVNLSARQFTSPDLFESVMDILARTRFPARRLELEITESMLMKKPDEAAATLRRFRDEGIQLAIDDFGTGYSSFAYLKNLPIHHIKVDRSFISSISDNPRDAKITEAIIELARGLELNVIAEGVETEAQLDILRKQGCAEAQGYFFSRPLEAAAFASSRFWKT